MVYSLSSELRFGLWPKPCCKTVSGIIHVIDLQHSYWACIEVLEWGPQCSDAAEYQLCGYWPQSFATQTAYPVTVTCWAVDDTNYKDRCFHLPLTSSVMMIIDSLLVHLIIFGTFSIFWWHLTPCQYIWLIFDSIFAYTWLFISAFWWCLTLYRYIWWYVTLCQCILMTLDFPSMHFDDTWLFISKFWWYWSLSVYFDGIWPCLTLLWVHLVICDFL